jgi:trans-aconitate methyltransferase
MDLVESKAFNYKRKSRHPWELARLKFIKRLLASVIRKINKSNPVIFDIGCGDAYAAFRIATAFPGAEIHAVDTALDEKKIREIQKLTGCRNLLLYDRTENIFLPRGKNADLILLLDVIEHIGDDTGFLLQLLHNPYVTDNTCLIITVPAYPGLFSSHDILLKHYRRYTCNSLIRTLRLSGYKSLESGYFFFVLLFPRIFRLYLEKLKWMKPSVKGIGQWNSGTLMACIIRFILQADNFICRSLLSIGITVPGLSVYALCKPAVS